MQVDKYLINFSLTSTIITCLLSLTIPVQAIHLISIIEEQQIKNRFITQAFLDKRCPEEAVHLVGSTKKYKVTICGTRTGTPTHYLADSKNGSGGTFLPLNSYTSTQFVARNGKYTYTLIIYEGGNGSGKLIIKAPGKRPQSQHFEMDLP